MRMRCNVVGLIFSIVLTQNSNMWYQKAGGGKKFHEIQYENHSIGFGARWL